MNESGVSQVEIGQEERPKSSLWKLQGVFFEPSAAFREIARRPNWLVPLLGVIVISFLSTWLLFSFVDFETFLRTQIQSGPQAAQLSQEQIDESVETIASSRWVRLLRWVGPLINGPLLILLTSGVLLLGIYLAGKESRFKTVLSIVCHSFIPYFLVSSVLLVAVVALSPDPSELELQKALYTNLGPLVESSDYPALYQLLATFDILTLYVFFLLATGLSRAVKGLTMAGGVVAVGIPYGLWVCVRVMLGWLGLM